LAGPAPRWSKLDKDLESFRSLTLKLQLDCIPAQEIRGETEKMIAGGVELFFSIGRKMWCWDASQGVINRTQTNQDPW
jgi:hypothetical protein